MFFENILPVPEGSKVTIVELCEYSQWKHHNTRKNPVLYIIYKDANDVKRVRAIESPKVGIFFTKPEYRGEWRTVRKYVPIEKVYPVEIDPKKIPARIYQELKECHDPRSESLKDIYERSNRIGDWKAKKEILKSQHTFMSDISVEEFYRIMLGYHYDCNQHHVINKAFLDIESDIYGLTTSEQENDMDPTNAVTVIFDYNCVNPKGPDKNGDKDKNVDPNNVNKGDGTRAVTDPNGDGNKASSVADAVNKTIKTLNITGEVSDVGNNNEDGFPTMFKVTDNTGNKEKGKGTVYTFEYVGKTPEDKPMYKIANVIYYSEKDKNKDT